MRISIGNDHAGVEYKNYIREYLLVKNIEVNNYGTDSLKVLITQILLIQYQTM